MNRRFQIIISHRPASNEANVALRASPLARLKLALVGLLLAAITIGVLIVALALGFIITAILAIVLVLLVLGAILRTTVQRARQ